MLGQFSDRVSKNSKTTCRLADSGRIVDNPETDTRKLTHYPTLLARV
jgi:hypothetical protein